MAIIDPGQSSIVIATRLQTETDPVLRRNLQNMLVHSRAELAGDFDAVLDTLSEEAQHISFNNPDDPALNPKGKAAILAYYQQMQEYGLLRLQSFHDYLVVDKHCAVVSGITRIAYYGYLLQQMGIDVDDPQASYLFEARLAVIWPFDENGLSLGEHGFMAGNPFEGIASRKLKPEDILEAPPYRPGSRMH